MKATEAIKQLQEIIEGHGDIEIIGPSFYGHVEPVKGFEVSEDETDSDAKPYGKRIMIDTY